MIMAEEKSSQKHFKLYQVIVALLQAVVVDAVVRVAVTFSLHTQRL